MEFLKVMFVLILLCKLQIWKYKGTKKIANFALGHVVTDVSMPHGLVERDILVGVGANGMLQ